MRYAGFATIAVGYVLGCTSPPPTELGAGASAPPSEDESLGTESPSVLDSVTDTLIPVALPPLSYRLGARPASRPGDPVVALQPASAPLSRDWAEAIRWGLWQEADDHFLRLAPEAADEPAVRYTRARVALQLGRYSPALELLRGLEQQLPALADAVAEYVARAQLEVGPFEPALAFYERRVEVSDLLRAARAAQALDLPAKARALLDRAVELAANSRAGKEALVQARRARALTLEQLNQRGLAALDWRWLALEQTIHPLARDADVHYEQTASTKLTKLERTRRLDALSDAALVAAVEAEVKQLEAAPGPPPSTAQVLHARAWALYQARSDYAKAAELFARAAGLDPAERVSNLYYEARALSRAHRDELGIEKYTRLAKNYPDSSFADHALFRAAHLYFILGRWKQAEAAYKAYDARYGKRGRNRSTVLYELALVQLAAAKPRAAREQLLALKSTGEQAALVRHLVAVAELETGQSESAIRGFEATIRDQPLSFLALVAAARLVELGRPVPGPIPSEMAPAIGPLTASPSIALAELPEATDAWQLPTDARWFHKLGFDEDAEAALIQQDALLRQRYEPRGGEVLCELYGQLASAAQRYRVGSQLVRSSALRYAPSSRTRWAWECVYPDPYADAVSAAESEYNLPPGLIHAVMRQESAFRPRVVSPAKAVGLMQLIPPTAERVARELGVSYQSALLESPPHNILFGAHYLSKLLATFGNQVPLALAAYNAGPAAVGRWLTPGETLPLDVWVARIPYAETRNYVMRVLGNWARYRYLQGGQDSVPQVALQIPRGLRVPEDAY